MTNAELADEIEPEIVAKNVDQFLQRISLALSEQQWQQIIAALRQSSDKVLVPREPTPEMIDAAWKLVAPESADYQAAPAFVAAMTKAYFAMLSAAAAEGHHE